MGKSRMPLRFVVENFFAPKKGFRFVIRRIHRLRLARHIEAEEARVARNPQNIRNFEEKVFSQNGEDGIIQEIFRRIGVTDRYFVEFGVRDGVECCTRSLLENHSWSGLWMDCSDEAIARGEAAFGHLPITILNRFISAENICSIFKEAGVPHEFDLLSVDIDGNDYWVWREIAGSYSPRCVILEYNASFTPEMRWVMPYNPEHRWDGTNYQGVSLRFLSESVVKQGYRLVGCDSNGVNAFLVRADLVADHFPDVDMPAKYHYAAPKYKDWFGHPGIPMLPVEKPIIP